MKPSISQLFRNGIVLDPIGNITLKVGTSPGAESTRVPPTPVTLFIGPNNSGKSQILKEMNEFLTVGATNSVRKVLETVDVSGLTEEETLQHLESISVPKEPHEPPDPRYSAVNTGKVRALLMLDELTRALQSPNESVGFLGHFAQFWMAPNTLYLGSQNRLAMCGAVAQGDLKQPGHEAVQKLFRDDELRGQVRRIVHDAFEKYFVLDPTNNGQLMIRFSEKEPDPTLERGLHQEAIEYHRTCVSIDELSDGVRAFVGLIMEVVAGDPIYALIDEPEAFLHPSLSFGLAKEVCRSVAQTKKRAFISTHSASFVMGCVQSGVPVRIVRLTYDGKVGTARMIDPEALTELMRNPLLRSVGLLSALFFSNVVVCEGDSDRAFYQEVNERLLSQGDRRGIKNALFLNAQNKQTIHCILKPLRALGIPAAGIVDIDVLKEGGSNWRQFLEGGFLPGTDVGPLAALRASLASAFDGQHKDMKRDGGISLLDNDQRESAEELFEKLSKYGLFVVSKGELESWLSELNVSDRKDRWLVGVFEEMGSDPSLDTYIQPAAGDVWDFVGEISSWMQNPARRGIPL